MKINCLVLCVLACASLHPSSVFAANCGLNHGWLPQETRSSAPSHLPQNAKQTYVQTNNCGVTRETTAVSPSSTWWSCDNLSGSSGWQPARSTVCKNQALAERCSRWNKERLVYGTSEGRTWSPKRNTVCDTERLTQTSDCGFSREVTGSKQCCGNWQPARNTICSTETFTQTSSCNTTREESGTKDCCVAGNWTPSAATTCTGIAFTQSNNCGQTRNAIGTGGACISEDDSQLHLNQGDFPDDQRIARLASSDLVTGENPNDLKDWVKLYSRKMPDNRTGAWVDYPILLNEQNIGTRKAIPVFTKGSNFESFLNAKAKNSLLNNPQSSDEVTFCLDTDIASSIDVSTCVDTEPRDLSCGPQQVTQSCECVFDTKGTLYPLCDECKGPITVTTNYTIPTDNNWQPATNTVCAGTSMAQTNDCGANRTAIGTRNCEEAPPPLSPVWKTNGISNEGSCVSCQPSGYTAERDCLNWYLSGGTLGVAVGAVCAPRGKVDFCWSGIANIGSPGSVFTTWQRRKYICH